MKKDTKKVDIILTAGSVKLHSPSGTTKIRRFSGSFSRRRQYGSYLYISKK